MNGWIGSLSAATIVDAAIVITLVECALLALWSRFGASGSGFDMAALVPSLTSGLLLMLALRAAVGDAPLPWIVLPVSLSGVAHGWDLWRRFKTRAMRTAMARA